MKKTNVEERLKSIEESLERIEDFLCCEFEEVHQASVAYVNTLNSRKESDIYAYSRERPKDMKDIY